MENLSKSLDLSSGLIAILLRLFLLIIISNSCNAQLVSGISSIISLLEHNFSSTLVVKGLCLDRNNVCNKSYILAFPLSLTVYMRKKITDLCKFNGKSSVQLALFANIM